VSALVRFLSVSSRFDESIDDPIPCITKCRTFVFRIIIRYPCINYHILACMDCRLASNTTWSYGIYLSAVLRWPFPSCLKEFKWNYHEVRSFCSPHRRHIYLRNYWIITHLSHAWPPNSSIKPHNFINLHRGSLALVRFLTVHMDWSITHAPDSEFVVSF